MGLLYEIVNMKLNFLVPKNPWGQFLFADFSFHFKIPLKSKFEDI
jgi:hypothetical protein